MARILALYYSGSGNTKHAVDHFRRQADNKGHEVFVQDITTSARPSATEISLECENPDLIALFHPIYCFIPPLPFRRALTLIAKTRPYFFKTPVIFGSTSASSPNKASNKLIASLLEGLNNGVFPTIIGTIMCRKAPDNSPPLNFKKKKTMWGGGHIRAFCTEVNELLEKFSESLITKTDISIPRKAILGKSKPTVSVDSFIKLNMVERVTLVVDGGARISTDECIGCRRCVEACPTECLMFNNETKKAYVANKKECIGCFRCQNICPVGKKGKPAAHLGRIWRSKPQYMFSPDVVDEAAEKTYRTKR